MAIVVLLQASDFESDENYFRRFLLRIFLPVSWQIFYIYDTQISTENIYRILLTQTGHCSAAGITFFFSIFLYLSSNSHLSSHSLAGHWLTADATADQTGPHPL
jgi:hypothetical protein